MITCPSCGQRLRIPPSTAVGKCPNCGAELTITALTTPEPPIITPRPINPPVAIPQAHIEQREPRLQPHGWFTRSFATTLGIVAALLLLPVICCGLGTALMFGGLGGLALIPATGVEASNHTPSKPQPTQPTEEPIITESRSFLAEHGYSSGVFFDRWEESIDGDTTHIVTGDIRTAVDSTPFRLSARVVPSFNGQSITFELLVVGGKQVFPHHPTE